MIAFKRGTYLNECGCGNEQVRTYQDIRIVMLVDQVKKREVQNWMKSVLAIKKTTEVLSYNVKETFEQFISDLPRDENRHLEIFYQCLKENEVEHFKTQTNNEKPTNKQKKGRKIWECTHHLCKILMERLLDNFENGSQKRLWNFKITALEESGDGSSKTTQTEEPDGKWMLMKLYMFGDGVSRSSLNELDLSQIIKLMRSCKLFTTIDGSVPAFEKALDTRNMLMHSKDNEVSDDKTKGIFKEMKELVSLFADKTSNQHNDFVEELHQLRDNNLIGKEETTEYRDLVSKVLGIKKQALKLDISLKQNLEEESKGECQELVQMLNDVTTETAFLDVTNALALDSKQREQVQKRILVMKNQYEEVREKHLGQKAELQKLEIDVEQKQKSVDEMNTRINTTKNQYEEVREKHLRQQAELQKLEIDVEQKQKSVDEMNIRINTMKKQYEEVREDYERQQDESQKLEINVEREKRYKEGREEDERQQAQLQKLDIDVESVLTVDTGNTRKGTPQAKSAARYSQGDSIVGKSSFEKHQSELNAKMEDVSNGKSSWSPIDMEVFKKPMCLISLEGENVLKIEDDPLQQISKIDWPMVVVSVVGLYRTGKSYLMNRLADAFKGFALNDTLGSKTKGIWVWCKKHPEKSNTVLLLLDTEGLGDVDKRDPSHDNRIFILATLLCNCLVYNMKGFIDQDAVNKLTFVTEMAKNIRFRGRCEEDNNSLSLILPDLVFCLRDFSLKLFKDGRPISENEYLENSLSSNKSKNEAFNKPRECIRKYFPNRECFTLPVPGDDVLENPETLHFNDLSSKFKEATIPFVTHVYRLKPKELLASKPINGQMFATLATKYVTALRDGAVPDVDETFKDVAKMENERISNKALDIFEDKMKKVQNELPIPSRVFEEQYMKFQQDALNFIRENVVHDETGDCERTAQMMMDNISNEIKKANTKKISKKCKEKLRLEFEKTVYRKLTVLDDYKIAGGYKMYQQDIQILNNDYKKSMVDYDQYEVLPAWIELMEERKKKDVNILKYDDDLSLKEKEDEKKKINKQFSDMKEAQKKKLTEALEAQTQQLHEHRKAMEKQREQKRKEEAEKYEEFVRKKLQKKQAEEELQTYKKEKRNVELNEKLRRLKKKKEEEERSRKQENDLQNVTERKDAE